MTKEEFHEILRNPEPNNGVHLHLQHCWKMNNVKAIFKITGLDFSDMFSEEDYQRKIKEMVSPHRESTNRMTQIHML
jgi:hypothetical protein